jgi:RNA-dependent RNA polymerase
LGALSNRHLACSAVHTPNHPYSLLLAEIISQAVDFPKTGVFPTSPKNIKIDEYPDFMENKHKKSFESISSIGSMYRQVKEVWKIHSTWQDKLDEEIININQDFIMRGYKQFIPEAEEDYQYYTSRINTMLSIYNLQNEYELITGCHSCAEEEKKNNDSIETALLEFRHLIQEMRNRFEDENLK